MNPGNYRVRRATVDDLGTLKPLWESMRFSVAALEKRLTEFQVAEGADGKVVGGIGFEITKQHGRIHSEAYSDFSAADTVRPMIWSRLQNLCMNHGIFRLWTQEQSPFWSTNGLQSADEAAMQKLPESWKTISGPWLTLKLKDEEAIASLDREFALFMESEKARSAEALGQARMLKTIVTVIAFILVLGVFAAAAWVWVKKRTGSG
ncbi:MAG: hypothetical protein EPO07_18380 [Verrucomicrobia bacterium]|nr:MAG: hypothetical protein EPO07_18380 [Verrucomicrobiota bacterium]